MAKQLFTITIGIPAYNEEATISRLLESVLAQEETDFRIEKIMVVTDACTDRTNEIVTSYKDKRIALIAGKERRGQIHAQNVIFEQSTTDAVVIFEADTAPESPRYLHILLRPLINRKSVGLVQGKATPFPSKTLLGRILDRQVRSHATISVTTSDSVAWVTTGRGGRAFSKFVYKSLRWPASVPEDVYAFHWCRTNGISVAFQKDAVCCYKTAQELSDFLKERQKVYSGEISISQYFPKKNLDNMYHKPIWFLVKPTLYFMIRYPLEFVGYACLKILLARSLVRKTFTDFWPTTLSTKEI